MIRNAVLLLFLVGFPFITFAQKEIYQGLFLYQFTKYVKWPDAYTSDAFVIGVIGNDTAFESINNMAKAKKETQGKIIVVERYTSVSQINTPHIIFIDNGNSGKLSSVINKVRGKPILLVTEQPGLAHKGSIINFVEKEGKMRFEINLENAKSAGLLISSSLSGLAILI